MRIVSDHILRVSAAVRAFARSSVRNVIHWRAAGSAILTAFVLVACGQRGPLYLPTVPPLPPSPTAHSAAAAPGSTASDEANIAAPQANADDAASNAPTGRDTRDANTSNHTSNSVNMDSGSK